MKNVTSVVRVLSSAVLSIALAAAPVPLRAGDGSIAAVKKVTFAAASPRELKEVDYPTPLVQLVTDTEQTDVKKDTAIARGQAVLSRSANTYLKMAEKSADAFLYPDTLVRFDDLNVWLLSKGSVYVVGKRGRLEIVAEALGRILINSEVYLRMDGSELLAFVFEGHVVLEANNRTLSLGKGQAGRLRSGEGPERAVLSRDEQADIFRDVKVAERGMKGGGGGGAIALGAALAVLAGAAVVAGRDHGDSGDRGGRGGEGGGGRGTAGRPDLVPDTGAGACRLDANWNALVTVRNQGRGDASASVTRVEPEGPFDGLASHRTRVATASDLTTAPTRAGATSVVRVSSDQLRSDRLRVTVDALGQLAEANEDNNTAIVVCPDGLR
jgi:hypothetical protein